jgi:Fe2+ transport system protein FeoA
MRIIISGGGIIMNLGSLSINDEAVIVSIADIDEIVMRRLNSLGVKIGSAVCLSQKTLFGGPCIFECQGKKVSIRNKDAIKIKVAQV